MSTPQVGLTPEKEWLEALLLAKLPTKPTDPLKDLDVDSIREGLTFSMEKVPSGAIDHVKAMVGKNTMTSLDKKGDDMKQIDTDEDTSKLKSIDPKSGAKVAVALKKINAIKNKVQTEKFKEAGYSDQKLAKMQEALTAFQKGTKVEGGPSEEEIQEFEKLVNKIDGEISDEVFTPLVRQGAMPENLVPDRYSKMKRTFEGASKGYEERLQKYTKEAGKSANLIRKLGVSQDVITKVSELGGAILDALPSGTGADVISNVKLATELLPLASGLVIETTEQILQKKDPQDIVNGILTGVGGICSKAIPDKDIAEIVAGSISAVIAGGKVARSIKDKNPDGTFQALAAAASSALSTAGTATGNDMLKDQAPLVIAAIVTGVKAKKYRAALKKYHETIKNGGKADDREVKAALAELIESSIDTIGKATQNVVEKTVPDKDQADEINELVESTADTLSEAAENELDEDEEAEEGVSDEDKQKLKELKETIKKQDAIIQNKSASPEEKRKAFKKKAKASLELRENRDMLKKLAEAEDPEFLNITPEDMDDSDDDITPPGKLQELILQLEKDQKIFKLVETLSSLPLQIAAEFFPPAGAALNFKQFAFQVAIAVKHARALLVWQDNASNAKAGASPQVHAMLSRVGMSQRRATEHSINAALYLTAGVGNIVTTVGGHAAPVGVAMTATAKVGLAAAALTKVAIDEIEMEKGWRLFQTALKNPANRKAARRAIESNPTLAKYSLAWGAIEGNDVFAKSALKKCGITPKILETEGANVQEVQRFLETMFDEDLIILRAVPQKKEWYPASKPVLTFVSWTQFLGAATTAAKPPLAKGSGGAVSEAFVDLNTADQNLKAATKQLEQANKQMKKLVDEEVLKMTPKKKEDGKVIVDAPMKMEDIQNKAAKDAKVDEAKKNLTECEQAVKDAIAAIQSAATGFKPLNETDKKEHAEMREYLDALIALGDLKLRELGGEPVALDMDEEPEVEDQAA